MNVASVQGAAGPAFLDSMHAAFARLFTGPAADDPAGLLFVTATGEVAANIVEHAAAGRPDCSVSLRIEVGAERIEAWFEDDGAPMAGGPKARSEAAALAERGRGLEIARRALDEFSYERRDGHNHWHLVKSLDPAGPGRSRPAQATGAERPEIDPD